MSSLQEQPKPAVQFHDKGVPILAPAHSSLGELIGNKTVFRFLPQRQLEVLLEPFGSIVQTVALEGETTAMVRSGQRPSRQGDFYEEIKRRPIDWNNEFTLGSSSTFFTVNQPSHIFPLLP